MSHVIQVPQGYASRVIRSSLPLGVLGLYAGSFGIWSVVVCASADRISLLFADTWVVGMVQAGYSLVTEEMDWVGHHSTRRNVVFCHPEGLPLTETLLGDLKTEFEIMTVERDVTAVYAGFTKGEFQISTIKDESLGFPMVLHPLVQRLHTVHKIKNEVFRMCQFKEHILFTGLWWSPISKDQLSLDTTLLDEEDAAAWEALQAGWGTEELLARLVDLIQRCVEKRGARGIPEGPTGVRYLAQSAVDSVGQYLKDFDAGATFVADMKEAMARWDSMVEDEDEVLRRQLQQALDNPDTAFGMCSGIIFARRHGLPPPSAVATAAAANGEQVPTDTPLAETPPAGPEPNAEGKPDNPAPAPGEPVQDAVSAVAPAFREEEDLTPYCTHMRMELEALAVKQHNLQMHWQKQQTLLRQKAHVAKVYAAAMRDFQLGDFNTSKEAFFECLRLGTLYLTAADPELSSAYYNAGRALHLAGILPPAKELLKTCLQLRTEQHRLGIIDQTLIEKTKQALQQCLQACHDAAVPSK
eukprot:EG_transcript_4829